MLRLLPLFQVRDGTKFNPVTFFVVPVPIQEPVSQWLSWVHVTNYFVLNVAVSFLITTFAGFVFMSFVSLISLAFYNCIHPLRFNFGLIYV